MVIDIWLFYPPYDYLLCVLPHDITERVRKRYRGHLVLLPPFWNWEWVAPDFLFISNRARRTHVCWDHRSFLCPTWPPNCAFCRWPPGLSCAHTLFCSLPGALHIRLLVDVDNITLVGYSIFPYPRAYFLSFSNQCQIFDRCFPKWPFIAYLEWKY